jgi:4-diphosphocytidyl-2-C-methyl-D-erythritol kinase
MPSAISALRYRSYAKINLYLDVLRKRQDGYHDIETIFQTVSLCDELRLRPSNHGLRVTCSVAELGVGEENLVYGAARLLRERSGCSLGARIHLDKRIPIAAGLAGGSGNAAATLLALNTLWGLGWPLARLLELALELGSDVPYCAVGGTAAATGRGEVMTPLPRLPRRWLILVHPPLAVSARHVYHHPCLALSPQQPRAGRTPAFRRALDVLAQGDLARVVFNRMEIPVFHDHPGLADIKERLLTLGCAAAAMSGSGPTLFGLCRGKRSAHRIAETITEYPVSVVHTVPRGVERVE